MGWNQPKNSEANTSDSPRNKTKTSLVRGLVAAIVVVLGAVGAWLMLAPSGSSSAQVARPKAKAAKREAAPVARKTVAPTRTDVSTNKAVRMEMGSAVVSTRPVTNAHGGVTEYMTLADGRKISRYTPPKQVFNNAADQMIAMLLTAKPGQPLPPLPDISSIDKDFVKAILTPIKVNDDDPDDVKALKQKVIDARATLVDEIKNGGSVREVLSKYHSDLDKIADAHQEASRMLREIKQNDGEEAAAEFRERVNQKFRDSGIPELNLHRKKKGNDK